MGKLELSNGLSIFLICPTAIADKVEITDKTGEWSIHWVINHPGVEFQQTVISITKVSKPKDIYFKQYKGQKEPPDLNNLKSFYPFYTGIPVLLNTIIKPNKIEQFSPQALVFIVGSESTDRRYQRQVDQNIIAIYTQAPVKALF